MASQPPNMRVGFCVVVSDPGREAGADPLVVLVIGLGLCIFAAAFVPLKRRP
jgi:hypothetical protein